MAFPTSVLPAKVFISPGPDLTDGSAGWVWTDITSSVRLEDGIHITQGRADEAARVDPSVCRLRLDNRTGDFTPRNPLGQWYGQLGRNTPLRVAIRRAEDEFDRTASNGWGTEPLWGGTWTTSGGSASDYAVSGGKGNISSSTTSVRRLSLLDIGVTDARITVDTVNPVVPTGASISHWVIGRSDGTDFYAARLDITTTGSVNLLLFRLAAGLGVTLVTATAIGTHSAGDTWRIVFEYVGTALRAKAWEPSGTEPSAWQVDTTDTTLTAGTQCGAGVRLESGNTSGTQTITFDNFTVDVDRFSGYVSAWPPRWDKSGNDATVPIEANGILRRLGQGTPPERSPMRRTIAASDPVAYWPIEDGGDAGQVGSAFAGHPAMSVSGTVTFQPVQDWQDWVTPGGKFQVASLAAADLQDGGTLRGSIPASATAAMASAWTISCLSRNDIGDTASGNVVLMEWTTPGGTFARWQLVVTTTSHSQVIAYNSAGAATTVVDHFGTTGAAVQQRVSATQNGGNIDVSFYTFSNNPDAIGSVAGTLAGPATIVANATGVTNTDPVPFGHLVLWASADPTFEFANFTDGYGATVKPSQVAFGNESATDRISRLCAEEGVRLTMPDVSADFIIRMGPQPAGTFLDLLQECADADQGVIYESGFGLGYLPREHRYNRAVALALDFDAGQVGEPPEPTDDDYNLVNRVRVKRTGGSSAVAEDADSIAEVGLYQAEVTVNHSDDTQLYDHAAWRVHLGT